MNIAPTTYAAAQIIQPSVRPAGTPEGRMERTPVSQNSSASGASAPQRAADPQHTAARKLEQHELRLIKELQQTDTEVRRHEMAHVVSGGTYVTSGANFTYQRGPDGKNYAVGGEVTIDTSPVPGDPQATAQKMRQVKAAALAPANPSPQDLKVAAMATSVAAKALSELMMLQAKEQSDTNDTRAYGNLRTAADAYGKVGGLPEAETSTISIVG